MRISPRSPSRIGYIVHMATQTSNPVTLVFDIGGSGVKSLLLDHRGKPLSERERVETPQPATPENLLLVMDEMAQKAKEKGFDRVSVGFPGVVKRGATLTAHNLNPSWVGFELEKVLARKWRKPVRVMNDAAVQGFGAINGRGVELVITLGTGLGSSIYTNGKLTPGLELAHHPWRKDKTYEEFLGKKGLAKYGRKRWNKLIQKALEQFESTFNYDHLYIGGGNAVKIDFSLPKNVTRVPNDDGLLGGVALWREF